MTYHSDSYYIKRTMRQLTADEIELLEASNNTAYNWKSIWVTINFSAKNVRNCHFSGKATIGDNVVLENIGHIDNYIIADGATIRNVGYLEFHTFCINGIKDHQFAFGIQLFSQTGSPSVVVTPGSSPDLVYAALAARKPELWFEEAEERKRPSLNPPKWKMSSCKKDLSVFNEGFIGANAYINNVSHLYNVIIGSRASVTECSRLEKCWLGPNVQVDGCLTIRNSILQNNVMVGKGCSISDSLLCKKSRICDGARIKHSVIGDKCEIEGGEVAHSFLYPHHRQSHNSTTLIAAHLQGLSDIAAGTVICPDTNGDLFSGGLTAGKGFSTQAGVSLPLPSSFAPYTLLARGIFPHPLHIPFSFSLVRNNSAENCLEVTPAYWWIHRANALDKLFRQYFRWDDKTVVDHMQYLEQVFEESSLKPFSAEVISAIIESHKLLSAILEKKADTPIMEDANRPVKLLNIREAIQAYREMLLFYITSFCRVDLTWDTLLQDISNASEHRYVNAGGLQLQDVNISQIKIHPRELSSFHHLVGKRPTKISFKQSEHSMVLDKDDVYYFACFILKYLCNGDISDIKIQSLRQEAEEATERFKQRILSEKEASSQWQPL